MPFYIWIDYTIKPHSLKSVPNSEKGWFGNLQRKMASFQFFGKQVLKVLKWKPKPRSSDETDSLPVPQGQTEVIPEPEVTEESPPEATSCLEETDATAPPGEDNGTGNETPKDSETSGTGSPMEQDNNAESPSKKSSSFRRRKFGAFMRPNSAKSFDTDMENAGRNGSKKGKKNFFSHVRALSMGHHHSIHKQNTLEGTKSVPHLARPFSGDTVESDLALHGTSGVGSDLALRGASVADSTVSVNVTDVDGNQDVFEDEVRTNVKSMLKSLTKSTQVRISSIETFW